MIQLTRLNGQKFILNALFIEQIQSFPDTTLTLSNGKKVVIKESEDNVVQLVKEFYREINVIGTKGTGVE